MCVNILIIATTTAPHRDGACHCSPWNRHKIGLDLALTVPPSPAIKKPSESNFLSALISSYQLCC